MKRICKKCGYIDVSELKTCPICAKNEWEDYELYQIKKISTDESFINAMVKLYKTDPIEYQLKIQQFKTQLQQQEHARETKQQQIISNQPHCPTCGSSNLSKVSTFSKIMDSAVWGFGGKQRYKTYHCNNCGYEW